MVENFHFTNLNLKRMLLFWNLQNHFIYHADNNAGVPLTTSESNLMKKCFYVGFVRHDLRGDTQLVLRRFPNAHCKPNDCHQSMFAGSRAANQDMPQVQHSVPADA